VRVAALKYAPRQLLFRLFNEPHPAGRVAGPSL